MKMFGALKKYNVKDYIMKQMIVIGAGAAGMMTAIKASDYYKVILIEKNDRPGKKLFITGKGRCNVTNASDEETFLKNVVTNPKFLYSAIYSYNQDSVIKDFINWGVPLKNERGNRVFPVSDHSSDVIKALTQQLSKRNIKVLYNTKVTRLITDSYSSENPKEKYEYIAKGVEILSDGKKSRIDADVIVITTGGMSYPTTGSNGSGFKFLKNYGISISPLRPALVPIETAGNEAERMMGLSLKNVTLKVIARKEKYTHLRKDKLLYEDFGEMLFTHFGVSGPLSLSASSYISKFLFDSKNLTFPVDLDLFIDLKPALTEEELDRRILRDFEEFHKRDFQNSLGKLLPRLLIPVIIERSGIRPDKKVNAISADEREKLIYTLKNFNMKITGLRDFKEAIITGGGISVKELSPQNMEFKKIKNLRAAGEVIDCDALTGGFNLQIAWCTAFMASSI